uniref:Integrase catalytic domain-containing protein n=1 Tax=Fagus sylvatica TaxID=28930 RepID=A0A2N9F6L7_FAGSY
MKVISTREGKPKTEEEVVGNLASGLGGITRSGRCYTPEELERRRKEIGKAAEDPAKTMAAEDEAADFLRIIKSSEYSIVKQLSKMPSHISVLSLLLASESHRKALLKVLNEAYVPEDITGPSFENMVTSTLVTNQLTFSDDELPPEGRGHTKALYISVKTNNHVVSKVLIDNGSTLNVCPMTTLEKLDIDSTRVRATSMVVRAFDGTRREVLGEIDLPIEVGPQVYNINFQVLRIDSPYNLLLGRPWLHTAGVVPSSLHQKMKLIIRNQLVAILAKEPISIYHDQAVPYIDGYASEETSFHSFEFVTVIHRVAAGLGCANQGRTAIVALEGNKDRYGLGYTPTRKNRQFAYEARRRRAAAKLKGERWPEKKMIIPHIRTTFPASAMFQVNGGSEDELALLFAENLSINTTGAEEDSTAPLSHHDQLEEEKQAKTSPTNTITIATNEEDELTKPPSPPKDPNSTTTTGRNNSDEEVELPNDILEALERQDEGSKPNIEELEIINLAEEGEEPKEVKIGTRFTVEQKEALIALLREFHEIFAWSYQDMPGLRHRHSGPQDSAEARMQACQTSTATDEARDHFEDQGGTTNAVFSFMDGFSGYNQIKMAEEDKSKTAFVTHWGTFVYDVMPFDLKNAGATYQRAMVTLFHDMIHHEIEVYVDDMIAKSRTTQDHLTDLRKLFQRLKRRRPLILYLTVQEASMGCMLGQARRDWEEGASNLLSQQEIHRSRRPATCLVEKTCCALAGASKKLRQYMLYYTTLAGIPNGPNQIIRPSSLGLMDSEFPDEDVMAVDEGDHCRWKLYFDGAANSVRKWDWRSFGVTKGTANSHCCQTNGEWQARDPKLIPYQRYISQLVPKVQGDDVRPLRIETRDIPAYSVYVEECMNVEAEVDNKPWYLRYQALRTKTESTHRRQPKMRRNAEEANRLIQEMHVGLMGAHTNGPFLARKIMRAGYYWLTMERDCIRHVQTCHKCQMYQKCKNAPPQYLHIMASPWPFSTWGMDVIGAITPKASNGHKFILVAINYFTKWVEACSFKNVTQVAVTRFVKNNIICRYGMPEMLITDNASNLNDMNPRNGIP